jgi:hypothetical protein
MAALGAALVLGGTACGKLKDAAGGKVPGGMPSTSLDPNACGGFSAGGEVGHKIHAFLEATQELDKVAAETAEVIKSSCAIMGKDLGMSDADMGGETDAVCGKVINTIQQNLQVSVKSKAALHIVAKPAECKADLEVQAKAAGDCEGKADVGPGGANASQECRATGSIKVAAAVQCTPPQFSIEADAKMVVDKAKLDMTIKALQDGIPKILDVKGRVEPLKTAVEQWAASVVALKDAGSKLTDAFKDQALCVGSQLGFAANMVGHIKANVSVSVSVSASASSTVGG